MTKGFLVRGVCLISQSWDFAKGKAMRTFIGHRAPVTSLQFDSAKVRRTQVDSCMHAIG